MELYTDSKNTMLGLDDIALMPSAGCSSIKSRGDVNPYVYDKKLPYVPYASANRRLPVFVAPMTSVVCSKNLKDFVENGFTPVLPRTGAFEDRCEYSEDYWTAFSMKEFEKIIEENVPSNYEQMYVLVDVANGHMKQLYDLAKRAKKAYSNIILMIGNIADAHLYEECCKIGIDYVRAGIGGGSACTTSVKTGIHVSLVDLIVEINKIRLQYDVPTKVIADGGINTIDKAVKCIALGYDYVMIGKMFAQTYEACGEFRTHIITADGHDLYADNNILSVNRQPVHFKGNFEKAFLERHYYGMASEQGQKDISGGANKNPEGTDIWVKIEWPLEKLNMIMESVFRSAMSYTDSADLRAFKESVFKQISPAEFNAYYK